MTRAIGHVRVSTSQQAGEHQVSLDPRETDIKAHCEASGYQLVQIYRDPGFSGASKNGPAFPIMLTDIQADQIAVIVCWKSDRLSRGLHPATAQMEVMEGIVIKMEACILAAAGKLEMESIRERSRMGAKGRARKGQVTGTVKHGHCIGRDGKPVVIEPESESVKRIFQAYRFGFSCLKIAGALNSEGSSIRFRRLRDRRVYDIFSDPVYMGQGKYWRRQYTKQSLGEEDIRLTKWTPEEEWLVSQIRPLLMYQDSKTSPSVDTTSQEREAMPIPLSSNRAIVVCTA